MRPLINLLRVAILAACAIWLMSRTPIVRAMNCDKFTTSTEYICNSCCSSNPAEMSWTNGYSDGAGIQVLDQMYASCGSPTNSCPNGTQYTGCAAGNNPWFQAVNDSACCSPSGFACDAGACCAGLVCLSGNVCGACRTTGQTCGQTSDCCNGACNGSNCVACPSPNSSCGGTVDGRPTQLQNLCEYPSNDGCASGYSYQTVNGGPCCMSTSSPIIIDVDGTGFQLTSAEDGVDFDFFADNHPIRIAWTAAGSSNAFLVRDLNRNHKITTGKELFGNLTPQPPSDDPNGFRALAQFDLDHEGWVEEDEAEKGHIQLWNDANHNGVTDFGELHNLRQAGIKRISVRYREDRRVDQYGNEFRYEAAIDDLSNDHRVYDVILQSLIR